MIRLVPMSAAVFTGYVVKATADYADDKVRSGQWSAADALPLAKAAFATLLPDGVATAGHALYVLRDDTTQSDVGALWFAIEWQAGLPVAYVYDVVIDPPHRRAGHAAAAFDALDEEAARRGLVGIALHVFGHNTAARALYDKLGFTTTNVNMFRPLKHDR